MIRGMNARMNIWRINFDPDDEVGGAVVTGTCVYQDVLCRVDSVRPEMVLVQQGLEVPRIFTAHIVPATLQVFERDEVEMVFPINHPYYGMRLTVRGVQHLGMRLDDLRAYIILTLSKTDFAHAD